MSSVKEQTLKNYRDEVRNTAFLPEKSAKLYTAQYEKFCTWRDSMDLGTKVLTFFTSHTHTQKQDTCTVHTTRCCLE